MEGKLIFALANLYDSKEKHKKADEKIYFLRNLLDKGKKVIQEFQTKLDEKTCCHYG